jgi:hypothetical protein
MALLLKTLAEVSSFATAQAKEAKRSTEACLTGDGTYEDAGYSIIGFFEWVDGLGAEDRKDVALRAFLREYTPRIPD